MKPEPAPAADAAAKNPQEDVAKLEGDNDAAASRSDDDGDDASVLQDTSELGDDGVSEVVVTKDKEDT